MNRTAVTLAAWWLGGLAAVTGIGLVAVNSVGDGLTGGSPAALSPEDLVRVPSATAGPQPSPSPRVTSSPSPPPVRTTRPSPQGSETSTPARSRSVSAVGGTARFSCRGSTLTVDFASPRVGFAVEVHDRTASSVRVEFDSDGHESRVSARCAGGVPVVAVEERPDGSGGSGGGDDDD